jgi:hypothetical protein
MKLPSEDSYDMHAIDIANIIIIIIGIIIPFHRGAG